MGAGLCGAGVLGLVCLPGCTDGETARQIAQLHQQNRELQEQNRQLAEQMQQAASERQADREQLAALTTQWQDFEQAFSPQQREQLRQNVQAASEAGEAFREQTENVSALLSGLRKASEEAERLKQLCQQHAEQAADADFVAKLEASIAGLKQQLDQVERLMGPQSGGPLGNRLLRLETDVRTLRNDVRSLESKVRGMESRVRRIP